MKHPIQFSSERGAALIFVIMMGGLLMAMASGLAVLVRLDTLVQHANVATSKHFYAAEGGANRGIAEFTNIFLNSNVPEASDYDANTMTLPTADIRYQLAEAGTNPTLYLIPAGESYAGMSSLLYSYVATAESLNADTTTAAELGVQFEVHNIPLFQFAAFYENDLEILPGPAMTLHGRIHTNSDLYLDSGATSGNLAIEDDPANGIHSANVSAAGSIFRGRKDVDACNGPVVIDEAADADASGDQDPLATACGSGTAVSGLTNVTRLDDTSAWDGTFRSGVDEINEPTPDFLDYGSTDLESYWQKADLRIVLDLEDTNRLSAVGPLLKMIEVQNADGSRDIAASNKLETYMFANPGKIFYNDIPVNGLGSPTCFGNDANDDADSSDAFNCSLAATRYQPHFHSQASVYRQADGEPANDANWHGTLQKLDYRRGGFWDNREGQWMYLLNVDVQALLAWNGTQGSTTRLFDPDDASNGGIVIYLGVTGPDAAGANNYGVRVFDSADLPFTTTGSSNPTGLTVVTDQAAYVQGDYNSVNWDPAAVMADSINILSAAWEDSQNDYKTKLPLDPDRIAAATTIHAAFLGGVDSTTAGAYNGGWENYPRFHEDWGGLALNYRGSFVSLGTPRHATGPWFYGAPNYQAPIRNWDFESNFEDAAKLPPADPRFVYVRQALFSQAFE